MFLLPFGYITSVVVAHHYIGLHILVAYNAHITAAKKKERKEISS